MKEKNGKMSFDHIAEKWAEALNAIYNEKLSSKELYGFLSEMGVPYYVMLAKWIKRGEFYTYNGKSGTIVYRVTDRFTKGDILPYVKQMISEQRAIGRVNDKKRRSAEQKRGAGIKWSDLKQAAPDLSENLHLLNNHLNLADATDSQLVDELRRRGFEVIAKKVTVVEL